MALLDSRGDVCVFLSKTPISGRRWVGGRWWCVGGAEEEERRGGEEEMVGSW